MSTRSVIARLTNALPLQFSGRYHHWDGYPSGLGQTLWQLYHGHFNHDLNALLRVLLDEHPAGWSTINGADFTQNPGFCEPNFAAKLQSNGNANDGAAVESIAPRTATDEDDENSLSRPQCYCHGSRSEGEWAVTQRNAAGSGCEWAYAFCPHPGQPALDVLLVLASYTPRGAKMIGFFGQGDPQARWEVVAVLGLWGEEPDWEALDEGKPATEGKPPASSGTADANGQREGNGFNGQTHEASQREAGEWQVEHDDRPGIYRVTWSGGVTPSHAKCHYVGSARAEGERLYYCTCSQEEEAPSPGCEHVRALQAYLQEKRKRAKARQAQGLEYSGVPLQTPEQSGIAVFVWEDGVPALLQPEESLRVCPHCRLGFGWGDGRSEGGEAGAAQLSLAILLDFTGDEELALERHQEFRAHSISTLPLQGGWRISARDIEAFLR